MQKINVLEIDDDVIGLYSEILGGGVKIVNCGLIILNHYIAMIPLTFKTIVRLKVKLMSDVIFR